MLTSLLQNQMYWIKLRAIFSPSTLGLSILSVNLTPKEKCLPLGSFLIVCHQIIVCQPGLYISFPSFKHCLFPCYRISFIILHNLDLGLLQDLPLNSVLLEYSLRCPHVLIDAMMSRVYGIWVESHIRPCIQWPLRVTKPKCPSG